MGRDAIDFVLLWVDENDAAWQQRFQHYKGEDGDKRPVRFRDMGTLRYWFRGVERFAPWVNRIYFVTCGQHPGWLNTEHPKLVCVRHDEYIPKEYLPTFSSHTIEWNLHRIPELSEQFVLFNDDMFLIDKTRPEDFFRHGLPCDAAILEFYVPPSPPFFLSPLANASLLNRHFGKRRVMLRHFGRFFSPRYGIKTVLKNAANYLNTTFPGFHASHLPSNLLKSVFGEIWAAEPELLEELCRHRFRVSTDVNQWAVLWWQYCTGRFFPQRPPGRSFFIASLEEARTAAEAITDARYKMVCLNDEGAKEFEQVKLELCRAFEARLPEKSSFER